MEDKQVARRRGDEHLGTVGRQTHSHQVAGVEELFVRAAVLCEPAGGVAAAQGLVCGGKHQDDSSTVRPLHNVYTTQ